MASDDETPDPIELYSTDIAHCWRIDIARSAGLQDGDVWFIIIVWKREKAREVPVPPVLPVSPIRDEYEANR